MADCTIEGAPIIRGKLLHKRRGNWTAYLDDIGSDTAPTGQVTISWLGTEHKGTVLRSGSADATVDAVVIGGKGGGGKVLQAAMYDYQLPVKTVLGYILRDAGEELSSTVDPALLSTTLTRYVRRADFLGQQLDQLADLLGVVWRVLPDGTFWLGTDKWTAAAPFDHVLSEGWAPSSGAVPILPEALGLLPGQLYRGPGGGGPAVNARVGEVVYCIDPDQSSAIIYRLPEGADKADGRLSQALRTVVREETAHTDYHKPHDGSIVLQRSDGTVDVDLDDKTMPRLTSARLLVPVAGAKLTISGQPRCRVAFEDGDSSRPMVIGYETGDATKPVALQGSLVDCGTLTLVVAMGVLSGTYTDPSGTTTTIASSTPIPLKGKITGNCSPDLSLP